MMLKLDKRYSSGLTVLFSYVFAKMLGDTDNASSTGTAGDGRVQSHGSKSR